MGSLKTGYSDVIDHNGIVFMVSQQDVWFHLFQYMFVSMPWAPQILDGIDCEHTNIAKAFPKQFTNILAPWYWVREKNFWSWKWSVSFMCSVSFLF